MGSTSLRFHDESLPEKEKIRRRLAVLAAPVFPYRFDPELVGKKNCEQVIGGVEVPLGVAGPVAVRGQILGKNSAENMNEEIYLPLATTEGALVASIQRGCKAINAGGGAKVMVKKVGMTRAPVWRCRDGAAAMALVAWIEKNISQIAEFCAETSAHLQLVDHQSFVRGRSVFVRFVFDTDEAMGMNMVTIALQHAWEKVQADAKYTAELADVELISLSSNVCTDKKDSVINRIHGRGYWVQAEVELSEKEVEEVLKTTIDELVELHVIKNYIGSNVAGSFSQNMHVGNAVAALFLATGQDLAHVTEGSQASTIVEKIANAADGSARVYISVTLPNVVLGTVGGGTWLPDQTAARNLIRQGQLVNSVQLATAVGVAALAGEISGLSALAAGDLASAHAKLGRVKDDDVPKSTEVVGGAK